MAVLLPGKGNERITAGMASLRDGPLGLLESRFARKSNSQKSDYSKVGLLKSWFTQTGRVGLSKPAAALYPIQPRRTLCALALTRN